MRCLFWRALYVNSVICAQVMYECFVCTHVQVGMGDLGEGEEGGGAGLGMGDVFGGVVTFDVTVGGALGESEWKKESGRDKYM